MNFFTKGDEGHHLKSELVHYDLVLIDTLVTTDYWHNKDKNQILEGYIKFWEKWQPADKQILLACLCIEYETTKRRYKRINKKMEEFLMNQFSEPKHCMVLPPLNDITQTHAREWAKQHYKGNAEDMNNLIDRIYAEQEEKKRGQGIPMKYIADKLNNFMRNQNGS